LDHGEAERDMPVVVQVGRDTQGGSRTAEPSSPSGEPAHGSVARWGATVLAKL
jgi:hypothetical protein